MDKPKISDPSGNKSACFCCGAGVGILACSGGFQCGAYVRLGGAGIDAARVARMGRPAGVASRAPGSLTALQQSRLIVALDGCTTQCGERTLIEADY